MQRHGSFLLTLLALALTVAPATAQTMRSASTEAPQLNGYGLGLATADGMIYVGEPSNNATSGLVYAYAKGDDGTWQEQAVLAAEDAMPSDGFGQVVLAEGGMLFVSAPNQDDGAGAVYVFQHDGSAWTEAARLVASDTSAVENLGMSLAYANNVLVAGTGASDETTGAAYIFRYDGSEWSQQAKLMGDDVEAGDRFGADVALAEGGALAMVGAPRQDGGSVYVFRNHGISMWEQEAKLTGEEGRFGSEISVQDGLVMVAAPRAAASEGRVFTYRYDAEAGEWDEAGTLTSFDAAQQYRFGSAIDQTSAMAVIGAPGVNRAAGALYVFERGEMDWTGATKLTPREMARNSFFGATVAATDDLIVAGVPGSDFGMGSVLVFERTDEGWMETSLLEGPVQNYSAVYGDEVRCEDGKAAHFECDAMTLMAFMPVSELGAERGVRVNDIWGWTDSATGKEYALVGRVDGTSFVDISNPSNPVYVGELPETEGARSAVWRDVKVYKDHAFIVADNAGEHGMQVFDLTQLRDFDGTPTTYEATALYDKIHSAHNIVINEESGFAYSVGSSSGGESCGGGLHMIDIRTPTEPTFAGCFSDPQTGRASTGYSHDAMCIMYRGPDAEHQGKEICFGSNETALSIADVTDKDNPVALARASYPNVAYTHQGWITEDHRYFYVNDELDELGGNVTNTRTLIWDVTDLDDPQLLKEFFLETESSDHNLYIDGNLMYQSNYRAGLRVFDISDPANPVAVGHFDTVPYGENGPGFGGSWSNYPFFESGTVVVTSSSEGLFIVKKSEVDI